MILPSVFLTIPAMILARVDLPPPLGPVMTINLLSFTVRLRSRIISFFPSSESTLKEIEYIADKIQQLNIKYNEMISEENTKKPSKKK